MIEQEEQTLQLKDTVIDHKCEDLAKLSDEVSLRLAEIFKVLGDPTRLKLLGLLSANEMCVNDISDALSMTQSAISHQLRVLRNAHLVRFRREGKEALYSLDDEHVLVLLRQGLAHVDCD